MLDYLCKELIGTNILDNEFQIVQTQFFGKVILYHTVIFNMQFIIIFLYI